MVPTCEGICRHTTGARSACDGVSFVLGNRCPCRPPTIREATDSSAVSSRCPSLPPRCRSDYSLPSCCRFCLRSPFRATIYTCTCSAQNDLDKAKPTNKTNNVLRHNCVIYAASLAAWLINSDIVPTSVIFLKAILLYSVNLYLRVVFIIF